MQKIIDEMHELSSSLTEDGWEQAARLAIAYRIDTPELVEYVDKREPAEQDDWTLRAELFEWALYMKTAIETYRENR